MLADNQVVFFAVCHCSLYTNNYSIKYTVCDYVVTNEKTEETIAQAVEKPPAKVEIVESAPVETAADVSI